MDIIENEMEINKEIIEVVELFNDLKNKNDKLFYDIKAFLELNKELKKMEINY